jgi:CTP:molybdopterin cytidylyltransferase MocA
MTAPREIAAVILAAGAGHRLGGVAKALLPHRGESYLAAIAATARSVGLADAVVVVGRPFGAAVAGHAAQLGLRVQINPDPDRGMASSVALGFAAISEGLATAAWLWPVDHPAVSADTLRRLIAALDGRTRSGGGDIEISRPFYQGRRGHPPLIARALWPELVGCGGRAGGAREVVRAARLVDVEVDDPGVLCDVDTPADREALG